MIGKKNIVFGFLFLTLTAGLGPYMVGVKMPEVNTDVAKVKEPIANLQTLKSNEYMPDKGDLSPLDLGKMNTEAIVGLNLAGDVQVAMTLTKTVHAHGNLESVLNIIAGIVLCFIAVGKWFKQAISMLFIAGAVLHSGMLMLNFVFGQAWAANLTGIGAIILLIGFISIAIAALMGFKGQLVQD